MSNKSDGFLKSIFKFSISTWINFIIGIASSFISTRIVSPDIYGLFNVFNTTVTTVMYITLLGFDSSLLRFYNEPPLNEKPKIFSFKLISLSTLSTILISIIVCTFFSNEFSSQFFGYASYYLVIMTFICVISNLILRYLNIIYRMTFNAKQYTIQNILIQTITRFCIIGAVLVKPTFEAVVFTQVIGISLLVILYIVVQRKEIFPRKGELEYRNQLLNFKGYKEVFRFAVFSSPTYIVTNLNVFLTQQIILWTINSYSLGIYSSASYFITLLSVVNGGFSTFWAAYVYGNYKEQKEKISQMHDFILLIMSGVFIAMMLFKNVIYLLIGPEYQASKIFVSFVLIPPILDIIAQTTVYGINIKKKNYILLINSVVLVILNVVLSLILIPHYGLIGAAFASVIAALVGFILNSYYGQKYYSTIKNNLKTVMMVSNLVLVAFASVIVQNIFAISVFLILDGLFTLFIYKGEVKYMLDLIKSFITKKSTDL